MTAFRLFLVALWLTLAIYTAMVISSHGLNLLPVFFGDMGKVAWPGQFNLDFLCFLALSALWTAWRNNFTGLALVLAVVAFFGGAGFLLPYLLLLGFQTRGDMRAMLLGPRRCPAGSAEPTSHI
jgi:hypothetical protein